MRARSRLFAVLLLLANLASAQTVLRVERQHRRKVFQTARCLAANRSTCRSMSLNLSPFRCQGRWRRRYLPTRRRAGRPPLQVLCHPSPEPNGSMSANTATFEVRLPSIPAAD